MIKQKLKPFTPLIIRRLYRAFTNYFKRLWRWVVILKQIRGDNLKDEFILVSSALYSILYSFNSLLKWQNPLLLFDCTVSVSGNGKFIVRSKTDDLWHVLPWRESSVFNSIKNSLKGGCVFVDAGANIGVYSVLASQCVGKSGEVISIEMIPGTACKLKEHIDNNNCHNVKIINKALSDHAGSTVTAYIPINKYGMASTEVEYSDLEVETVEVRTETLDNILKHYEQIDLIKMDLEGAELKTLKGSHNVLKKTKQLIFESHTDEEEIKSLLAGYGFKYSRLSARDILATK